MKKSILDKLKSELVFLDGAMGTELQKRGLEKGELPERFTLRKPEAVEEIHRLYLGAGCDVISANTFGANPLKYSPKELKAVIDSALTCAENAVKAFPQKESYIALDIGPLGKILKPFGDLDFEDAVEYFAQTVRLGKDRADLILIETMNDAYETKAAVLAAKENCSLPIFVTNVYDEKEKLMTGADAKSMIALLEGLSVDAVGMNCSLGPKQMNAVLPTFFEQSSLPVIITPNAGLPHAKGDKVVFDVSVEEFTQELIKSAETGARVIGGCCGTTPEYMASVISALRGTKPKEITEKNFTVVSSYTHSVCFDDAPVIIGERINPTGKKRVKQALLEGDLSYILKEGLSQTDAGAHILDVNCGLPQIDEAKALSEVTGNLQAVSDTPLQIDTSDPVALEKALRAYNGKAMINSVNGKEESMSSVLPLAKKYGGVVVALTLDEKGIPDTAEGRVAIAERIIARAEALGIKRKDIVVDTLTMAVSADKTAAEVTLRAVEMLSKKGIKTILGVSNISFGLPHRDYVNSRFFSLALLRGLSSAIMNPHSERMMQSAADFKKGSAEDEADLVKFAEDIIKEVMEMEEGADAFLTKSSDLSLKQAICTGLSEESEAICRELLKEKNPLDIVNEFIVPALDEVGAGFEAGRVYLPRLLMSAEAAKSAFSAVKEELLKLGADAPKKEKIIIATVHGDIHDIGKNIVKILLENYGYRVIDLGKDVPEEVVVERTKQEGARLVALSALMTTTVPSMERTIKLLREECPEAKVTVGGAVLSADYAESIGADFYSKDAMGAVRIAESFFGE
ncbi:MAG: homocysteine S-methyltransferase family protein [Ruminococcus sp.]